MEQPSYMRTILQSDYKTYLSDCRDVALEFSKKQFPIDKLGALIGKEEADNFRFASGYVSLKKLIEVIEHNNEPRAQTRFNYRDKEGVIKQRTSSQIYGQIVALNYEIAMTDLKIKKKELWELPEVVEAMPDIKERKKLVGRFVKHKCEGVINYQFYTLLRSCVIKYFMVEWPCSFSL
jgi:hypothetical protein